MLRRILILALAVAAIYYAVTWSSRNLDDIRGRAEATAEAEVEPGEERPADDALTSTVKRRRTGERAVEQTAGPTAPPE